MSRLMSRSLGNSGGRTPPSQKLGGGGGDEGEKVFFDDGQVKVTESLVTIGPPWNKAFAVSQIRGVTYGKNCSHELTNSFLGLIGMVLILAGILSLAAGFTAGFFAGVFTGIGVLWGKSQPDAPFSVSLDFWWDLGNGGPEHQKQGLGGGLGWGDPGNDATRSGYRWGRIYSWPGQVTKLRRR